MSDNEQKNKNRETVADILAKMERESIIHVSIPTTYLKRYSDRIKAAWERERAKVEADALSVGGIVEAARKREAEPVTGSHAFGNAAAMRKALEAVKKSIDSIGASALDCDPEILRASLLSICARLSARIEKALAAPTRNCDVGTAEEQAERMRLYCNSHGEDESGCFRCEKCPFLTSDKCELSWAQMPYEAQEGDAK